MDKPPANPAKWILIGCGALAGLAILGTLGVGFLWWLFSSPSPKPTAGDPAGAVVAVPPGAVDRDVKIELQAKAAPEAFSSAGVKVVGKVWSVQVDGQDHFTFKKPVRVSLPFDRSLVRGDAPVGISRWENFHWRRIDGSRVEGDRVVADVDHFSEVAPTQEDKTAPASFLDVDSWHVAIDVNISGSDSGSTEISSFSWSRSRSGSASFRLPMRIPMGGDKGAWITPFGSAAPEDQTRYQVSVNDGGYHTDNDYDRNGNVFYYSTATGGGGGQTFVPNKLEIDLRAGSYNLSGSVRVGKVVKKSWATFGDTSVKTSEETLNMNYSLNRKLPATQGTLTDTFEIPSQDLGSRLGGESGDKHSHGTMTVTLTPGPPALAARILGPQIVRRVDQVPLDGTASTGDIAEYLWKFTIAESCPVEGGRKTELRGPTVSFHALWDFEAELVVKDRAGKTASTKRTIKVLPRDGLAWQTKYESKTGPLVAEMRAGTTDLAKSSDPNRTLPSGAPLAGGIQIGINQCVPHPETAVSGHYLHTTDPANKTWIDVGYELKRVGDDGPFRGLFFVSKQQLEINRIERVNTLLSNYSSELYKLNPRNEGAVQALFKQAKEHEKLHSTLAKDELLRLRKDRRDPAALIEAVIGLQLDSTKRDADKSAEDSNLKLMLASNEDQVQEALQKSGRFNNEITIKLPMVFDDNGVKTTIPVDVKMGPLWKIGDK